MWVSFTKAATLLPLLVFVAWATRCKERKFAKVCWGGAAGVSLLLITGLHAPS